MEAASFDLQVERWIPATTRSGAVARLGMLECLEKAHELGEITEPSPLVTVGIYRFLAAVLQRYLVLADEDEWAEVWDIGKFTPELIDAVHRSTEGRMDLFHPTQPFYQSGDIPLKGKPAEGSKSVGYLFPEQPTGTNVAHFSHAGDRSHVYCPACCALGLVTIPAFASSGGAGIKPSINGVPPIYVMPSGGSLFETLMLNYILPAFQPKMAIHPDPGPIWEQGPVKAGEEQSTAGFCESLTWPARRVRLFPSGYGRCSRCADDSPSLVRQMVYVQGRSRPKDLPAWDDPWVARRESKGGMVPIRPRADRDVWRDFSLLFLHDDQAASRPPVLRQLDTLLTQRLIPSDYGIRFEATILRTDGKAKVFEWHQDQFDFPAALLHGGIAAAPVEAALDRAEKVDFALKAALRKLHPTSDQGRASGPKPPGPVSLETLATRSSRSYWRALEPVFRRSLSSPSLIGSMSEQQGWVEEWVKVVIVTARRIFETTVDGFDSDSDALRRRELARGFFYARMKALASTTPKEAGNAN